MASWSEQLQARSVFVSSSWPLITGSASRVGDRETDFSFTVDRDAGTARGVSAERDSCPAVGLRRGEFGERGRQRNIRRADQPCHTAAAVQPDAVAEVVIIKELFCEAIASRNTSQPRYGWVGDINGTASCEPGGAGDRTTERVVFGGHFAERLAVDRVGHRQRMIVNRFDRRLMDRASGVILSGDAAVAEWILAGRDMATAIVINRGPDLAGEVGVRGNQKHSR